MTRKITVPDLTYCINGDVVELQQSMGCGEYSAIDVHKIHLKLIAEEMRITEPAPASMSDIVKLELMELLDAAFEHWDDIGRDKHADLDALTQARALYHKTISVCRIAGCDVGDSNDDSVTSALPTKSKAGEVNTRPSLLEV